MSLPASVSRFVDSWVSTQARCQRAPKVSALSRFRHPLAGLLQLATMMMWILQPALVLKAGQSSANGYTLTVWADQTTVNPGDSTLLYSQLVDASNSPVGGATLYFTAVAGDGTVQTNVGVTDGSGQYAMGYTSGSSTTQINVFDGNGYGVSTSCVVNVNPPPPMYQIQIGAD